MEVGNAGLVRPATIPYNAAIPNIPVGRHLGQPALPQCQQQEQKQNHRQDNAHSQRAHHAFGFAFVAYQVKQACAQTGYNTHQANNDDYFNDNGWHSSSLCFENVTQYMRIATHRFKPTLAGTLAVLVLLPLLLRLGFWQLDRADEKRTVIAQFAGGASTTENLSATNATELSLLQHVKVHGRFDSARQVLLDNMPASKDAAGFGRPGYRVLTPLLIDERQLVLIDRGWVPLGRTREELPDIQVEDGARTVHGRLAELPRAGFRMKGAPEKQSWPRVLNFPTLQELQAIYGTTVLPRIVLLDENEPDGFRRDWSARYSVSEFGPEKHIGYAVQWFGLALALLVIYVIVGIKRSSSASASPP